MKFRLSTFTSGVGQTTLLGRCVACGDRKGVSAALKKVYTAFDEA
ncbi:hypothetical protein [Corynebacterium diphtheriae]|nr:hypothetical protein [Corynebacterium diphtheriae]